MYESHFYKVKLAFTRNAVIVYNRLNALVTMYTYNSLESSVHKDIVGSGGAFMVVIDAR